MKHLMTYKHYTSPGYESPSASGILQLRDEGAVIAEGGEAPENVLTRVSLLFLDGDIVQLADRGTAFVYRVERTANKVAFKPL